uniref:AB hydrolase-1 domain-containing protein n=1 Tax=Opuntia streptacantha TaxID=393608 RepID=A0A7C9DGK3_OPUST
MLALSTGCWHLRLNFSTKKFKPKRSFCVYANGFPSFLPADVENIKDTFARDLAQRIERLPVQVPSLKTSIMSSCVRPVMQGRTDPVVLLHGFDSSVLEWRYMYPLLEEAGVDAWAIDILGWGFSGLESRPSCDVASKRNHLYQVWKSYIKKPMILVGPSLGAAVAIDFAIYHPEAVSKLVLIDASVYAEGTGEMSKLPRAFAYAGVKQQTLIIWGEDDQIIRYKLAFRLHGELQDATLRTIPECGHLPHVERPRSVADLIIQFAQEASVQFSAV